MICGFLSTLTVAVVTLTPAQRPAPVDISPVYERLARADVVLVGKVDSLEDQTFTLPDKSEYRLAVVKVSDPIFNAKELTRLRVGIRATPNPRLATWAVGQELCLFLSTKPGQTFFVAPLPSDSVARNAATFEQDVTEAKRLAKLLDDPDAALKSKDADERLVTAAMLLTRYRTVKEGQTKQTAIDQAQSTLILQAIADADWDKIAQPGQPTPQLTFAKLGLTPDRDNWIAPRDFKDYPDTAKAWIARYAEMYRIMQFISEKKD